MFQPYVAKDRVFQKLTFDFLIADDVGKSWYDSSTSQFLPERQWCVDRIKRGMTVVDCGAHHGMMSVIFSQYVGPQGKVFSYDAVEQNAEIIRQNATINNLNNIIIRPVGVGDANYNAHFLENSGNVVIERDDLSAPITARLREETSGWDDVVQTNKGNKVSPKIQIVTLDDDLPTGTHVDFVKIDVEGFEVQALNGMKSILAQKPIVALEIHNLLMVNPADSLARIANILNGYNFSIQGDVLDEISEATPYLNIEQLLQFENPHIYCEPAI